MIHKNFRNIDKVVFGRGAFSMIEEIIKPHRQENAGFFVFIVDAYFEGKELSKKYLYLMVIF